MILNYKVKNYKTFKDFVELSFIADMRTKKFQSNTISISGQNLLKAAGIYGPNNTGKSCLLESIYVLKRIMLNEKTIDFYNSFYDDTVTEFEISYEINGDFYKYSCNYDSKKREYVYERLDNINVNNINGFSYNIIFSRTKDKVDIKIPNLSKLPLNLINNDIPLFKILKLENTKFEKAQKDYLEFANSIQIVNMESNTYINKTLELIISDEKARKFIVSFAKNCDLNLEDFGYSNDIISDVDISDNLNRFIASDNTNKDLLKIWSKHHNKVVPSIFFDSVGTRKLILLAGYIYDSIVNGKILLIDELDSSLHHVIIRAIISLFNNELNNKAQLIFSTHDALTMDLRRLFRKDQIYLTDIDEDGNNKLIHLSEEFKSRDENGLRGNEDIVDYYLKGRFGAIPTPDLFGALDEVLSDE